MIIKSTVDIPGSVKKEVWKKQTRSVQGELLNFYRISDDIRNLIVGERYSIPGRTELFYHIEYEKLTYYYEMYIIDSHFGDVITRIFKKYTALVMWYQDDYLWLGFNEFWSK